MNIIKKKGNQVTHNHIKPIHTNTHDNKNQYIIRHMQYIYQIINISMLMCAKISKYTIKTQWEGIHWLINQTPHFLQLKFKFDTLKIPNGVVILWTCVFHDSPHSTVRLAFYLFVKNWFFRKILGVATYFNFFEKENKIRKKTLCDSLFGKDMSAKIKSGFGVKLLIGKIRWWVVAPL